MSAGKRILVESGRFVRFSQAAGSLLLIRICVGIGSLLGGVAAPLFAEDQSDASMVEHSLTALTFNIRYANLGDGLNAWPFRRDAVGKLIRERRADVIGLQEVLHPQLKDMQRQLPEHDHWGVGRDDGKQQGEYAPIFYRRDRFELVAGQTIWLSPTPEKPSKGWDASHLRIATIVTLRDKLTGRTFRVANTHFDHRGEQARLNSAELLRVHLDKEGDEPTLLMGDFNCRADSPPIKRLTGEGNGEAFRDTRTQVEEPAGPDSTWNGFRQIVDGARIDFIFLRGPWRTERFEIIDARQDDRYLSDHLPVTATFAIPSQEAR